jgi:hypothetical protein
MGGNSSTRWSQLGDIRALEQKAKQALQAGTKNVFISFAMEDEKEVNLLRGQAKNENSDIEFNDQSVKEPYDSERRTYIQQQIAERIRRASVTVVYLSDASMKSPWVKWEVEESIKQGKRVIGVYPGKTLGVPLPSWYTNAKIPTVAWSKLSGELAK